MIRVTFELLPHGDESSIRTIGLMEIANVGGTHEMGDYHVVLRKCPPFTGALRATWRSNFIPGHQDAEVMTGAVEGHHRQQRGVYDLAYRALAATVGNRNRQADQDRDRTTIEHAVRLGHEALLESLRAGIIWPTIHQALAEAGLQIVASTPPGPRFCTTCGHAVGHPDNCAKNHGKPIAHKTCSDWAPVRVITPAPPKPCIACDGKGRKLTGFTCDICNGTGKAPSVKEPA